MTCHSTVLGSAGWQKSERRTAALLSGCRIRLCLSVRPSIRPSVAGCVRVPGGALLCSALLSLPLRQSDAHRVSSNSKYFVSPVCFLGGWSSARRLWSGSSDIVYFTYKFAAECESETHSRRAQLPCGLQSNAEKSLFWQDSHLLPCEGQGLRVGCL